MPRTAVENVAYLQVLQFHKSDVTSCGFDHNFCLATGSSDKTVAVWEWSPGMGYVETSYSPITEHKYSVSGVFFHSQEPVLVTSSFDGSILLWNTENGTLMQSFMHANLAGVRSSCFIPNGNFLLSAGDDGTLCIWDTEKNVLVKTVVAHEESITTVCCSVDGKLVLTGDTNGVAKIWHMYFLSDSTSTSTKSSVPLSLVADCHDLGMNNGAFSFRNYMSDEGKVYIAATCGNDNTIKLWKLVLSKNEEMSYQCLITPLTSLNGHISAVTCVRFSPTANILASVSIDKTTRLWKTDGDYICLKVLEGHSRYVTTCCFSADGRLLATGSNDKSVIVWDLTGRLSCDSYLVKQVPSPVQSTASFTSSPYRVKKVTNVYQKLQNLGNTINTCCFSKNNLLAAAGTDKLIRVWHQSSNSSDKFVEVSVSPLDGHRYAVNQIEFNQTGDILASCSVDGTAVLWDMSEYRQKGTLHGAEGGIKACRFSPDGTLFATGGDSEQAKLWDPKKQLLIADLNGHVDTVTCLSFTEDSKYLASGCTGGYVRLWQVFPCISTSLLCIENVHDLGLNSMDFPTINARCEGDNDYVLVTGGCDSLVKLWGITIDDEITASSKLIRKLQGHGGDVTCVRFAPGSSSVVASSATDKTARIWNLDTGTCLHVLDSKDTVLTCCAFSADGVLLAAGGLDKSVTIWDVSKVEDEFDNLALSRSVSLKSEKNSGSRYRRTVIDENQLTRILDKKLGNSSNNIPDEFICPITQQIMENPVICADGYTYEMSAIESWFSSGKITSPLTNEPLSNTRLTLNTELEQKIKIFVETN